MTDETTLEPRKVSASRTASYLISGVLLVVFGIFFWLLALMMFEYSGWDTGVAVLFACGMFVFVFVLVYLGSRQQVYGETTVCVDQAGMTISRTLQGETTLPEQRIAWGEIYGFLGRGTHKEPFIIEFHTNGPPPGRHINLGGNWGTNMIALVRPYAKHAGYTIKPKFTGGFLSAEIWRLFKI